MAMVMKGFSTSMGLVWRQVGRQRQRSTVMEERSSLLQIWISRESKSEAKWKKVKVKFEMKDCEAEEQNEGGDEQPVANLDLVKVKVRKD